MKKLSDAKKSVLGNMIIRQTMGGTRKEDKIRDKDELIERIRKEYNRQDSETTYKLNLTMLDVSKVNDMSNLFTEFNYLKSIDVSNWDVSNVKYMYGMFAECNSLESIDVSNWNVSNVEDMQGMFKNCKFDYKKIKNKLIKKY